jgi:hypothetical protein
VASLQTYGAATTKKPASEDTGFEKSPSMGLPQAVRQGRGDSLEDLKTSDRT